ncbi:MAG: hypothetical protein ACTSR7_03265 [Promethearchaeota archaeon]
MKLKVTTAILMSLFLVSITAVSTQAKPEPNRILMVDIMAQGDDGDIFGATTFIQGKIEYDKVSGVPLGRVEFHIKIYDDSGEKFYSMKGKLKNGMVIPGFFFDCSVRHVRWINLWLVMGEGMIRTTDAVIEDFLYRDQLITLPNTGGKYVPATIMMMASPEGEYIIEVPDGEDIHGFAGGWVFAGIMGFEGLEMFGGVTGLTKYMEKWVP